MYLSLWSDRSTFAVPDHLKIAFSSSVTVSYHNSKVLSIYVYNGTYDLGTFIRHVALARSAEIKSYAVCVL